MQLQKRLKKIEEAKMNNFSSYISTISDEELEEICRKQSVENPKQSSAIQEVIQTLSDYELELISLGKRSLLSTQTLRRLENANKIKD